MKFVKKYSLHATGGKKSIRETYKDLKKHGIPCKMCRLKNPIGLRTHGVYYRAINQRIKRR